MIMNHNQPTRTMKAFTILVTRTLLLLGAQKVYSEGLMSDIIVVAGGGDGHKAQSNATEIILSHDKCQKLPELPQELQSNALVVSKDADGKNKVLSCGGFNNVPDPLQAKTSCYVFDKDDARWKLHSNLTTALSDIERSSVRMSDGVYIFGTYTSQFLPSETKHWEKGPAYPAGDLAGSPVTFRHACAVRISKTEILLMGGAGQGVFSDASNSVWKFNVKSREWKSMKGMLTARAGHGCTFLPIKDYVVVSGGYSLGCSKGCTTELYHVKNGKREKAINDKQPATSGWSLVTVDKPKPTVYRLGLGVGLQKWQVSSKTWEKSSLKVKSPRTKGGVVAVNSDIICLGGKHTGDQDEFILPTDWQVVFKNGTTLTGGGTPPEIWVEKEEK